jgi:hypothetical protein
MATTKGNLKGSEALRALEAHSGAELKECRQMVEQASLADITAYFKGADLGSLNASLSSSLVSAAIAGGQWGFNSLMTRLGSSSVHESDLETVANEILELVSPHTKLLNYARFRVGAVQSYVAQCEVPSFKLQAMLISKDDLGEYQTRVESISRAVLRNEDSVTDWLNSVDALCDFLSNSQLENSDKQASRSKKGTVSTKSISSYSKHWLSYGSEILSIELGFKWSGYLEDSIQGRFSDLVDYKARSWDQLQRDLNETKSTRRAYRAAAKKPQGASTKLASYTSKIGNSSLKITFNLPSVDKDLITPAINLLRGQLIRSPKAPLISVNLESEGNSLIVELSNPKREILSDVEVELNAHL